MLTQNVAFDSADIETVVEWGYISILGRRPDPQGQQYWSHRLQTGASRDEFTAGLMASGEFLERLTRLGILHDSTTIDRWTMVKVLGCDLIVPLPQMGSATSMNLRVPVRDESVTQGIIDNGGFYEPHVSQYLAAVLNAGDTFLEVGANLGYYVVVGSRLVGDAGAVLAFEPVTSTWRYCQENIALNNLRNVQLFQAALWSEETSMDIAMSETHRGGAAIMGTSERIQSVANSERITCVQFDHFAQEHALRLDNLRVIKMDVEGAEPMALDGLTTTIEQHQPKMVLEVNRHCLRTFFGLDSDAIWQRLTRFGYTVLGFRQQCLSATDLPPYHDASGQDLFVIESLDTLNALCPEDGLIDVVAVPRVAR